MRGVTVGAFGNLDYVKDLGKKSTESDIQLASFKEGDVNVSMVIPIRYPEKVQSLAYAVLAADAGLLVVSALTKETGEQILAADAAGVPRGVIVLQNFIQPEQIAPLLKGTALEKWEVTTDDKAPMIRQKLAAFAVAPREGPVRVPIDHHFDVKGIGTVILGFVKQGSMKQHDNLRLFPSKKIAQVRSIQVHDVDVKEATTGEHVGAALKNVDAKDVDRGMVLAPDGSLDVIEEKRNFKLDVAITKYYKQGVELGRVYFLALGMQIVPVRVKTGMGVPGATGQFECEAQKPFTFAKGDNGILLDVDSKGNRVVGRARVAG